MLRRNGKRASYSEKWKPKPGETARRAERGCLRARLCCFLSSCFDTILFFFSKCIYITLIKSKRTAELSDRAGARTARAPKKAGGLRYSPVPGASSPCSGAPAPCRRAWGPQVPNRPPQPAPPPPLTPSLLPHLCRGEGTYNPSTLLSHS